jgi:hypothetical protein
VGNSNTHSTDSFFEPGGFTEGELNELFDL